MLNKKNIFALICVFSLLVAGAFFTMPRTVLGQMTIPTRTPVPDDGGPDPEPEPTDDNGGGGGGDNQPDPTDEPDPQPEPTDEVQPVQPSPAPSLPTATPVTVFSTATPSPAPSNTPAASITPSASPLPVTATPAVTVTAETITEVVAFPANSQPFPQAGQCGIPPTFTTLEAMSVYSGPGEAYRLVGLLGANEVRPIVGRAAFARWWMVQLDNTGRVGWVPNGSGTLHGFTGRVPIISAPALNGVLPTPGGIPWSPTPDADCNAPELLAGVTAVETTNDDAAAPPSGDPDSLDGLPEYDLGLMADALESETAVQLQVDGAAEGRASGILSRNRQAAADPVINELADAAAPLDLPASTSSQLPNLMPIVGVVLILAAVAIGVFARRNNRSSVGE